MPAVASDVSAKRHSLEWRRTWPPCNRWHAVRSQALPQHVKDSHRTGNRRESTIVRVAALVTSARATPPEDQRIESHECKTHEQKRRGLWDDGIDI